MVSALAGLVEHAGATFYADPFESAGQEAPTGLLGKLKTLVQPRQTPEPSAERPQAPPEPARIAPAAQPDSFALLEEQFASAHAQAAGAARAGRAMPRIVAAE
jgi:hypothetical protein